MKVKKHDKARWFSVAMVFMLLFSYGWVPGFGQAQAKSGSEVSTSLHKSQLQSAKQKINRDLVKQFSKKDQVTFMVKLKDQVNTQKVVQKTAKQAKKNKLSAAKTELKQHTAVVSALRAKSIDTQASIKQFLKKQKKAGEVKDFHSYYIVNAMVVTGSKDVAQNLATFGEVEKILPNRTRHLIKGNQARAKITSKKKSSSETKAKTSGYDDAIEPNVKHIGAPQVWDMGIDGSGVVIGSLDSGVQWDHPALKRNYRGYNPENPDQLNNEFNWFDATEGDQDAPYDDLGHGTHTTGTMVGSEADGSNQIGVAPGAQWIAAKAFGASGTGTDADILAAGEWMLAPKDADGNLHPEKAPDIINNSWGGGAGLDEFHRPMVKNWRAAGIYPVFAAGNVDSNNPGGPGSVASPGNYPESFAVGATNNNDELAGFSLQGPSPYDEIKPDVVAPGVAIRSSIPGGDYGRKNGTSMAAPVVSGTVALLLQANASMTVGDVEDILLNTAKPLTDNDFSDSPNNGYGHGLIQAFNAVSSIVSGLGTIEGSVRQEGEDKEPPTYQHKAPDQSYAGEDIPLKISVQDNVDIKGVQMQYRNSKNDDWQTIEAALVDGNYKDGVYNVSIPGDFVEEPSVEYRWKIADYGGNDVTTNIYKVDVKPGITTGYSTDFETPPVGWNSYGLSDYWERGKPTSGPGKAFSGENVYATNLDGGTSNMSTASLEMPPIDLPNGESYLQFKQWYSFYMSGDLAVTRGYVNISTDRVNWTRLGEFGLEGESGGWVDGELRLSEYANQRVYIAFQYVSLGNMNKPGWYLDDVTLSDTSISSSNQADLGVMPPNQNNKALKKIKAEKTLKNANIKLSDYKEKKNKKLDDLSTIKPGEPKNVQSPVRTVKTDSKSKTEANTSSSPLGATVSVMETGVSVNTNPRDGSYSMTHPAGMYTLQADAYGYYSQSRSVEFPKEGKAEANFTLEPIPEGTVTGTVKNKATGEPVADAILMLMEDATITPVVTDENGNYSISGYEGTYTLRTSASNYYGEKVEITINGNETIKQDVEIKPYIGYSGEIGYDDGTPENARAFFDGGNGLSVRMSLPEGKDRAMVTGGKFLFWNKEFPSPGGTEFQVEIWDASGSDGAPGKKLAGPIDATAIRDNTQWTTVDLSGQAVIVDDDFYMVYIQPGSDTESPGLASDENSQNTGRSWKLNGGSWSPSPEAEGNYMIRALVDYEVTTPVIISPEDGTFTNEEVVTVKGEAVPTTEVTIMTNGDEVATTKVTEDGTFSADITLNDGENVLTATASTDSETTESSEPVTITLDTTKPEVTIDSPKNEDKINRETITVEGTVSDVNLGWVEVNGHKAEVADDGSYSKRILLDKGENKIKVVAQDLAGNVQTTTISIDVDFVAPTIENLAPTKDKSLESGESVKIEFDSEPGQNATFFIHMPLTNARAQVSNATELPMMEVENGHYVGYWTATNNIVAEGAVIEVKVVDDFGNETRKTADGKLFINVPNEDPKAKVN